MPTSSSSDAYQERLREKIRAAPYRADGGANIVMRHENIRGLPMDFSQALYALKRGQPICRTGWNGKGMFIVLMPRLELPPYNTQGTERKVNDRTAKWIGEDAPLDCQPYVAMYTATMQWQPGWLCSQADMLAEDWEIFENKPTMEHVDVKGRGEGRPIER